MAAAAAVAVLWQLRVLELCPDKTAFISAAVAAKPDNEKFASRHLSEQAALGAMYAVMASPLPALAQEEDEGFDGRILAVLALPLAAITWALFNVWRSAFRQVIRITNSKSGNAKVGLSADD